MTSRPKDIDYPQLLSIQTLDHRTTGATLFQMERRPFVRSGLVQAETAYRGTNTNVSRSEMPADPMGEHHNPDPNSKAQRKLALVRAARQYAKQYTWRTKKDPLHSDAEHHRATRNLLRAASSLPRSQHRRTIGTEHGKLKPAISPPAGCRTRIPNQSFQRNPRAPPGYCGQLVQHRKPAHETAPQHARSVKVSGSDLAPG